MVLASNSNLRLMESLAISFSLCLAIYVPVIPHKVLFICSLVYVVSLILGIYQYLYIFVCATF